MFDVVVKKQLVTIVKKYINKKLIK